MGRAMQMVHSEMQLFEEKKKSLGSEAQEHYKA